MNICMVGYGSIADCHMQAFSAMDSVRPRVLVGRQPVPTAEFASKWGFEKHTLDLDEALADPQVDAVVITTPNDLHALQAIKTLEARKHLLLEIPIAMSLADAKRVAALSRQVDRRLMVCHSMRFMPALREVKRRAAEGQLDIHQIVLFFGVQRRTNTSWTGRARSWTDNILWHHAAHAVDLALWVTDCTATSHVHCRFGPPHPVQKVMDLNLSMVLPSGALVSIAQSYHILSKQVRWRALFLGDQATLEFREGELLDGDGKVLMPKRSVVELADQNHEFLAAVHEGRDPSVTGEDVLPAMQVLHEAQICADAAG